MLKWIVINEDGTYAGVPCESVEETRELVNASSGRKAYIIDTDEEVSEKTNWLL